MNLSTNSISLLQICSDGGDGASPNFMILVMAQLVLRPSLESSASRKMHRIQNCMATKKTRPFQIYLLLLVAYPPGVLQSFNSFS